MLGYNDDAKCQEWITKLTVSPTTVPNFTFNQGILRHKGRVVIGGNIALHQKIFSTFHSSAPGGHSGEKSTLARLKLVFYWPGMKEQIIKWIKECAVCMKNKAEHCPYPGLLQPLPIPEMAWTHISMDFVEGLPKSEGKNMILLVVDRLTKYAHFIACSHPYTTTDIVQLFTDHIFKLHGLPSVIVTDRDPIFTSKVWQGMFQNLKVSLHLCSAYHPQTDGQIERVKQCLENYLRCMTFAAPKKWFHWLSLSEWWYNTSFHTSLQVTPFQALYGFPPPMIAETVLPDCPDDTAKEHLRNRDKALQVIKDNLAKAQARTKHQADKHRTEREFAVGDIVYLKIQPYRHTSLSIHKSVKLHSKFYGPFRVLERIGKAAYKLLLPEGCQLHPVFHVSQLKKHLGSHAVPSPELPLIDAKGNVKVAPEEILERRLIPRNNEPVVQWRIKWVNLPASEASWEDANFIRKVFPSFHP